MCLDALIEGEGSLENDKYIVSWAFGHLVTLCEPDEYDKALKRWSAETLPIIPESMKLKAIRENKKQLDILKKLMNSKGTESLICANGQRARGRAYFQIYL